MKKNYTFRLDDSQVDMINDAIELDKTRYRNKNHFVEVAIHELLKKEIKRHSFYKSVDVERFYSKIKKTDDCWLWIGGKSSGYGIFSINSNSVTAHRFSYELHYGLIPSGYFIRHKCGKKECVNPEHLVIGTQKDNMVDDVLVKLRNKLH